MKAKTAFPAVLLWILTCAIAIGAQAQQKRTNIVFILTDDQGVWAAGCYGNPEIRTPNIDRLAATGVRFENFFTTIPVCSASRASFLTGRIPSQHGVHDFVLGGANAGPDAESFLADEICYTDVLSQHGWTRGLSGKWHLGNSTVAQHGFSHLDRRSHRYQMTRIFHNPYQLVAYPSRLKRFHLHQSSRSKPGLRHYPYHIYPGLN